MNSLPDVWDFPPKDLVLGDGEVHLWRAMLDLPPDVIRDLKHTLASDELCKADQFHFQRDRDRYVASKGCQRDILARYLHHKPDQLQFFFNPYGKPGLVGESGENALRFNLSHSQETGLFAVARGVELGVDIERVRGQLDVLKIAHRFFSPTEAAALEALPASAQNEAFFACWTRKEAYIKARGEGLSFALDKFSVSLALNEPPALLISEIDPQQTERWRLYHLDLGVGCVGALAIESREWKFKQWYWQGTHAIGSTPCALSG